MKILFIGGIGVYYPLLAAGLFTGKSKKELFTLAELGDRALEDEGYPIFVGTDQSGHQVYCLGVGSDIPMVQKALRQLVEILGYSDHELLIQAIPCRYEGPLLRLYQLSKLPGLYKICLRVVCWILNRSWAELEQGVREIKMNLKK